MGYSSGDNFTKIWYRDSNDNYVRFGAFEPDQSYSPGTIPMYPTSSVVLFGDSSYSSDSSHSSSSSYPSNADLCYSSDSSQFRLSQKIKALAIK